MVQINGSFGSSLSGDLLHLGFQVTVEVMRVESDAQQESLK